MVNLQAMTGVSVFIVRRFITPDEVVTSVQSLILLLVTKEGPAQHLFPLVTA